MLQAAKYIGSKLATLGLKSSTTQNKVTKSKMTEDYAVYNATTDLFIKINPIVMFCVCFAYGVGPCCCVFGTNSAGNAFTNTDKISFLPFALISTAYAEGKPESSFMYPPKKILEKILESPTLGEHTRLFIEHLLRAERLEWGVAVIQHSLIVITIVSTIYLFLKYGKNKLPVLEKVYNFPFVKGVINFYILFHFVCIIWAMYEIIQVSDYFACNPIGFSYGAILDEVLADSTKLNNPYSL